MQASLLSESLALNSALRIVLSGFHSRKTQASVDTLLMSLYEPILFRGLAAANSNVRRNSLLILFAAFPLQVQIWLSFSGTNFKSSFWLHTYSASASLNRLKHLLQKPLLKLDVRCFSTNSLCLYFVWSVASSCDPGWFYLTSRALHSGELDGALLYKSLSILLFYIAVLVRWCFWNVVYRSHSILI